MMMQGWSPLLLCDLLSRLFPLPEIQHGAGRPVYQMILADLSWHLPDTWRLTTARKHRS